MDVALHTFAMLDQGHAPARVPALASLVDGMQSHELSAYDLSFLFLAQQLGLPLATLDQQLARAARNAGVDLLL